MVSPWPSQHELSAIILLKIGRVTRWIILKNLKQWMYLNLIKENPLEILVFISTHKCQKT